MDERRSSPTGGAPEVVPGTQRSTFGFVGSDDYEYYEPPPSGFDRNRSPVPEYQRYDDSTISQTSPRFSARSPPPTGSDIGRSPQLSESGFTKSRPLSPSVQYSEIHSPDPETVYQGGVYNQGEKEAVYNPQSKVPSYHQAYPVPGVIHQNSGDRPQVISTEPHQQASAQKRPFYKRWVFILGIVALIIVIVLAVVLGVVFGTKKSHNTNVANGPNSTSSPTSTGTGSVPTSTVDPNIAVGGYISPAYYSTSGAWNGSGIAIAAAKPGVDQSLYAFYQDSTGLLQYTLLNAQGQWNLVGPVNSGSYKALNGTPISAVNHQLGNQLVWHIFYVDVDYMVRERIITNTTTDGPTPIWKDGPLSSKNLKTWNSPSIGLQACYWGNYYGQWSYSPTVASAGIHLWYASDATIFQQYSWTNGTSAWTFDQQWNDLSGNGGVGCQTWDTGMTEYAWFVDTKNNIQMYWKDNNRTGIATPNHPVGSWTPVDIKVGGVQKDSSLGYTNYMIYQALDTTIRGANMTWGAENTTIAQGNQNGLDTWTLQAAGQDIHAIRGTHLSITAISTASKGAAMLAFFQQAGNDVRMYSRDAYNTGGLWSAAAQDPVTPSK